MYTEPASIHDYTHYKFIFHNIRIIIRGISSCVPYAHTFCTYFGLYLNFLDMTARL